MLLRQGAELLLPCLPSEHKMVQPSANVRLRLTPEQLFACDKCISDGVDVEHMRGAAIAVRSRLDTKLQVVHIELYNVIAESTIVRCRSAL